MVQAYWQIGKLIVKKQGGNEKAEYGEGLIISLSNGLTQEFGKGFTVANLRNMRQFYLTFPKHYTLCSDLTWSHYRILMRIENEQARTYYEEESIKSNWSVRQLQRQITTFYYERLLASKDKKPVIDEMERLSDVPARPQDILRDPYVLEFVGFKQNTKLLEKDLEQALINHLQEFLLELGNGFAFVGRQKRISFDDKHFYIDLVFYNIALRCYVLIDLKIGELTHQDLGQMQMYVNYYGRELTQEEDNPPIGIVLCADKNNAVVKYTLPEGQNQIFASKYQFHLPTEEELKREISKEYSLFETNKYLED